MPVTVCKRKDCEYHGIEVCMVQLRANCHKGKAGKYVSDNPVKVLK